MVNKALVSYVQTYHSKGYSLTTLRDFLVTQGYSKEDVEEAIKSAYSMEHIPKNRLFIALSIVAVLVIFGSLFFLVFSFLKEETAMIDLRVYGNEEIKKGGDFQFKVALRNIGTKKDYDVRLKYELVKNEIVEQSGSDTVSSESIEKIYTVKPKETGFYSVRVSVSYFENEHESSLAFKVVSVCGDAVCDAGETCADDCTACGDGICSENENCEKDCKADLCGNKVCDAGEEKNCSDCKIELCGNGICDEGEDYINCLKDCEMPETKCGNNICETGESPSNCASDCRYEVGINSLSQYQIVDYVNQRVKEVGQKEIAKECAMVTKQNVKDVCFYTLMKATNSSLYCKYVENSVKKDDCYVSYSYETRDYDVCIAEVSDISKRKTCEQLKKLYVNEMLYTPQ